jgi:TIR domain-containing protein
MARIFLSHSWRDDRDVALRLRDALNRRGHDVFVDTDILDYGTEWGIGLMNALMNADGVIVLLTQTSMQSQFVLSELGAALASRRRDPTKFLIPVISGIDVPDVVRHLMVAKIDPSDNVQFESTVDRISNAIVSHGNRTRIATNLPRLFISHRHVDEKVAAALVDCIRTRFSIETHDIRCTSVHPYRLRAGEDTDRKLREEVVQAEAVLGLISPTASQSTYTMFELGAAWGNNVYTCPLLIKGATAENLPAPIQHRHPLDLRNDRDCMQLLDDLETGSTLQRVTDRGVDGKVMDCVRALVVSAAADA